MAVLCERVADLDALFLTLAPRLKTHRVDLVDLRSGLVLFERSPGEFRQFQSLASRRGHLESEERSGATVEAFLERAGL